MLLPFAWIYGFITGGRNWLYDKEILSSKQFEIPIIGIGNLSVGGTGKTPMAEYILQILMENGYRPALLSRGYKRKSKGFQIVKPFSLAEDVGDEPFQVKRKFPELLVVVCEDRVEGVNRIRSQFPEVDVIVLDDCLQHRNLKPGFNILLTDFNKPYFEDHLLPAGRLRESHEGRKRADIIVVTKCKPKLTEAEKLDLRTKLKASDTQEVFFSSIDYLRVQKVATQEEGDLSFPANSLRGYKILLFVGIANPTPLINFLKELSIEVILVNFSDHYHLKNEDIKKIEFEFNKIASYNKLVLTTEKDWRRMEGSAEGKQLMKLPLYFLPISIKWEKEEKLSFDEKILTYVRKNTGNR